MDEILAEHFLTALGDDEYPMEAEETVWGLKMGTLDGTLVYNSWKSLYLKGQINQHKLTRALANGTLPESFERWVRETAKLPNPGGYLPALIKRGFQNLPWDIVLLERVHDSPQLQAANIRSQTVPKTYTEALKAKEAGNKHFRENNLTAASTKYESALSYLAGCSALSADQKLEQAKIFSNLAQCNLQRGHSLPVCTC
eukprot:TRINITY_DN67923_c7_g10_i1.p1 TRINITY_DN67923_c7_g10~~TRINITY_DN67923_c7_g10_i1.p1  ORF type:complete len:199 (+),score=5.70 TRINITY_DN67923_c7_g10_i1:54-650(+)